MFVESISFLAIVIGAFAFGYHTGASRARDKAEFDRAARICRESGTSPRWDH